MGTHDLKVTMLCPADRKDNHQVFHQADQITGGSLLLLPAGFRLWMTHSTAIAQGDVETLGQRAQWRKLSPYGSHETELQTQRGHGRTYASKTHSLLPLLPLTRHHVLRANP